MNKYKSKARNILVATDVASRGLDIPHVDIVINFDIPTHSKVTEVTNVYTYYLYQVMLSEKFRKKVWPVFIFPTI